LAELNLGVTIAIIIGIILGGGVLLIGILVLLLGRQDVTERINKYVETPTASTRGGSKKRRLTRFSQFRNRLNVALGALNSEEAQMKLGSANWRISVSEYQLIRVGSAVIAAAITFLITRSYLAGLALGVAAFSLPGFLLFRAVNRRQGQFQDQLIDTLTLIRGSVSAGASFLQSLDVVAGEMTPPSSEEFRRVRREVELGLPMSQALTSMAERMDSDDLYLVVNAVVINSQVGGNLTQIMDSTIETIRNRIFLLGEIRALTSYARYTSYLLTLLPVITAVVLVVISPTYFERFLDPGITRYILIYAVISMIIGNIVMRRVGRIEV
jgi:tight adherence protein B